MTRQVLGKSNNKADEGARLAYFTLPPPNGVAGVHPDRLVDVDETGVWLAVCRRRHGHVPRGEKGETHAPYQVGKKYTVTLAIDTGGVVAYMISDAPGTTSEMWYAFLQGALLPNLHAGGIPNRVLVHDNLIAHRNAAARALILGSGYVAVNLPKYSCDLGSVEFAPTTSLRQSSLGTLCSTTSGTLFINISALVCLHTSYQPSRFHQDRHTCFMIRLDKSSVYRHVIPVG